MDIAYYDSLWRSGPGGQESESFWDGRADHFGTHVYKGTEGKERLLKLLSLLTEKGLLTPESSVLDIGCGPGKYAVEMARRSKEVTALDISAKMLAFAEENKKKEKVENLFFFKLDWGQVSLEELNWEKGFDLVFASMCPAVNSKKALEKMIRASRGYCFMSTFAKREESIRDVLAKELLPGWDQHKQGKGLSCCCNILWLMGYYPEITYWDSQWENRFTLEEAYTYYVSALPLPGGPSERQSKYIKSFLQKREKAGLVTEQVRAKFAYVWWKV
ncbi:methyltransferase domain-containing protein [Thermanaerosceptrum fracticalcis]|uniref:Methyltransferase domain-containing protein n=1 Tax=Thermanaerosceptrum fracticalcis TaxID=1712410 RepID=A0A7G6E3L9_THEFR|nr:class I SAM-dependent methyltransferase [Thermanaerosceptrum fracticalcis]QNB46673.1 methyltransferase domain-containing protein [Thermanaerosceptrum fracticalcis]